MRRPFVFVVALILAQLSICAGVSEARWRCRRPACCCPGDTSGASRADLAPADKQLVTPQGTRHRIIKSNETDPGEFDEQRQRAMESPATRSLRWDGSDGETFSGLSRRAAKVSISNADIEEFDSLFALLDDLPGDADMRDGDPHIPGGHTSNRVDEEDRNVSVTAFLYAASGEDDNDYHLIIGGEETDSERFMNVEVSGLPISGPDRDDIEAVREQFANALDGQTPGSSYDFYDPPIPVRVVGSLFYDVDHPPGQVGPQSLRDRLETSWEIHPITSFELAD
jgi:hypothetical protein